MFETTTSTFGGNAPIKATKKFAWSYSRLKNWRSCPKRHFHYDISKDVVEEKSEALAFGDEVHAALHKRLSKNTPLPAGIAHYETYVEKFLAGVDNETKILVEQKLAVTADFKPCGYFDRAVWFRAIADAVKIKGRVALNWDWKTGKPPSLKNQKDDPVQILTAAACLMAQHPQLQAVKNEFIWLEYDLKTTCIIKREQLPELWAGLMPEVKAYQHDIETQTFLPKKNGLCREYCGVVSCPYHGG